MKPFLCLVLAAATPLLAQVVINGTPTREFGQPLLFNPPVSAAPNLVEGMELYNPSGIAFDGSVSPPHVYIVDTGNNRVLGWNNANNLTQGNTADLVIGQSSLYATFSAGPGGVNTSLTTGLSAPTGIAVDSNGNVYVADSGNNRILRFKTPFNQPAGDLAVDLVIGQKTSNSGAQANQGQSQQNPSANSLNLSIETSTGQVLVAGLALDGQGTLWVADVGNNRVLGFPAASLAANTQLPAATVVLGQSSFISSQLPNTNTIQTNLAFLAEPTGLAVDSQGNLYVADQDGRVIQYTAPIQLGESGSKVLGVPPTPTAQGQTITYPSSSTLGSVNASGTNILGSPQGVFVLNGSSGISVFVCDSPQNRVVRYDTFSSTWTTLQASANSPVQNGVIGQLNFGNGQANQGQLNPSNQTFSYPIAGAINPSNSEMWVVDQANNRVVAFANQGGGTYSTASRVIGQNGFVYGTANLIVGSEVWISNYGGGVAIDSNSTPPHLYIADSQNNRILCFKDARNVGTDTRTLLTQTADLVIGQADLLHSTINYPNGAVGQPSATGLYLPVGVAVDANGNLWVADSGNGRAVRFPAPFAQPAGSVQTATVVLGQPDFATFNANVSQYNMTEPFGLAIFADGGAPGSGRLAVSDAATNRILVFAATGGTFTNGEAAQFVLGQPSFTQFANGSGSNQLNSPRGLAVDSGDRLYVADSGNNRLIVFSKPTGNNPSATLEVGGLSQPQDVIASFLTGRIWVTSTTSSVLYQFPEFNTLQINPTVGANTQQISSYGPLAVALDPFDNLIVADSANRITFYFAQMYYRNTASYAAGIQSTTGPTPGMLTEVALYGSAFSPPLTPSYGTGPIQNLAPPWPTTGVSNVEVLVYGLPAPIFRVDPAVISFEIPNLAPQSGAADFVVMNPTTGQILAAATFTMQPASPGLYTTNSAGTGQVAATVYNSAGSPLGSNPYANSPSNPVSVGDILTLWLTGAGYVPNLPPDGTAPGGDDFSPQFTPTVLIAGQPAQVIGSVISPQFPGLWQINVVIPANTPPSTVSPVSVIVELDDYASNIGGTSAVGGPGPDQNLTVSNGGNGLITTIYVK